MSRFAGVHVVVTGGSRGIGYATVEAFLQEGARVAFCGTDDHRLQAAESRLNGQGEVLAAAADVREPEQVAGFLRVACERFGPVEVLVNNAGRVWVGDFARQGFESIDELIDVNLKGVMFATRAVLPGMLERGRGAVINIASGAGLTGFGGAVSYCTSKFGVVGFTESLDREVRGRGIRVFGLCPGRVATDMQVEYSGHRAGLPPERVAQRILQLADPASTARTGTCIPLS